MTVQVSPLAQPLPWSLVAESYTEELLPSFEVFAREALRLTEVNATSSVVDVAAGPGTISVLAARLGARVQAIDFAPEMIAILQQRVAREGLSAVEATVGDGMALPYGDSLFDAAFSMFGLMFFPDCQRGFRELLRVLKPGGRAVVSSWVDMSQLPAMAAVFGALTELVPPPPNAPPRGPLPLTDPATCVAEMSAAGFSEVSVRTVEAVVELPSTQAWLDSMERNNAPLVLARRNLGERWADVSARLRAKVQAQLGPGPLTLRMPANLLLGSR